MSRTQATCEVCSRRGKHGADCAEAVAPARFKNRKPQKFRCNRGYNTLQQHSAYVMAVVPLVACRLPDEEASGDKIKE